jgi:hypothetical protein
VGALLVSVAMMKRQPIKKKTNKIQQKNEMKKKMDQKQSKPKEINLQ